MTFVSLWRQPAGSAAYDAAMSDLGVRRIDDKRRARLNVISHILETIPYKKIAREKVTLPKRSSKGRYDDQASLRRMKFVEERY